MDKLHRNAMQVSFAPMRLWIGAGRVLACDHQPFSQSSTKLISFGLCHLFICVENMSIKTKVPGCTKFFLLSFLHGVSHFECHIDAQSLLASHVIISIGEKCGTCLISTYVLKHILCTSAIHVLHTM